MKNGEHYFHTKEQMYFSDNWFMKFIKNEKNNFTKIVVINKKSGIIKIAFNLLKRDFNFIIFYNNMI